MSTATELLREALESLEEWKEERNATCDDVLIEDIRVFLAAEKEADEPVAYGYKDRWGKIIDCISRQSAEDVGTQGDFKIPLYTRPAPARKPMTEEEIKELCPFTRQEFVTGFNSGIRFAEKHHGIGANLSDPDSIDLQSRCRGDKL